jgi:peptide/nickel transport system permease protein
MRPDLNFAKRDKLAAAGLVILLLFAAIALFAEFIAPYSPDYQDRDKPSAPRTPVRWVNASGDLSVRPFIYAAELSDPLTLTYRENTAITVPIGFLVRGEKYRLLGIIESDLHLFGTHQPEIERVSIAGTDALGRDRFSRIVYAIRFSFAVSLLGTIAACIIGILIGMVSGYSSNAVDTLLMGSADAMLSLPTLILILAARAAFPLELPTLTAGLLLVSIFAATGWAEMARLARGLVVSMRGREFVLAARAIGLTESRILFRHILPNISRPLLTQATLLLPAFMLAEAALSFLGVGLQEPAASLGNLLSAAGEVTQLRKLPFELLSPSIPIVAFVLGVRLLAGRSDKNRVVS